MWRSAFVLIAILQFHVNATISDTFYRFLHERHGQEFADKIARKDFGKLGSFGGGNHTGKTSTDRTPVLFITGWHSTANFAWPAALTWLFHGYTFNEIYATTYGQPMAAHLMAFHSALTCEYIKHSRNMIKAVAEFTRRPINVVAYSMGGPVSRKAILGGKCVDTGEDLGPPLTRYISTYLGVGGANNGALPCSLEKFGVCNKINGMNCHSKFIKDINSKVRYEGKTIYVLQTSTDEMVGYKLCGKHASEITGANKTVTVFGYGHMALCTVTPVLQYNLIHKGDI
ncbi:hypothetical protein M3Y94_01256300 [Aphelenchoides besseyi]|nr:hypothetical protein M3Y94_01256300 [Aphelenchoides besseyi]